MSRFQLDHRLSGALASVRRAAALTDVRSALSRGELLTLRATLEAVKNDADLGQQLIDQILGAVQ